ncbi:helix-turn-helix domain-containing protein [Streptomyces sp. NPDC102406]|uniref:helix-turn-helix domain-containing protein n=1 Tax=Streptomyces sp. NPDC102406 TaxID=3366171 RepID=UPI0037FFDF06
MLRVRDVARHFDVHVSTVYRWIHRGSVAAFRNGQPYKPGDDTAGDFRIPESVLNSPEPLEEAA